MDSKRSCAALEERSDEAGWRIVDRLEEPLGDGDMILQQNLKGYMQMQHKKGERSSGNRLQRERERSI